MADLYIYNYHSSNNAGYILESITLWDDWGNYNGGNEFTVKGDFTSTKIKLAPNTGSYAWRIKEIKLREDWVIDQNQITIQETGYSASIEKFYIQGSANQDYTIDFTPIKAQEPETTIIPNIKIYRDHNTDLNKIEVSSVSMVGNSLTLTSWKISTDGVYFICNTPVNQTDFEKNQQWTVNITWADGFIMDTSKAASITNSSALISLSANTLTFTDALDSATTYIIDFTPKKKTGGGQVAGRRYLYIIGPDGQQHYLTLGDPKNKHYLYLGP